MYFHITRVENFNILNSLNHNKVEGIDGIGLSILRFCRPALLSSIITLNPSHGILPSQWKVYTVLFNYLNNEVDNHHAYVFAVYYYRGALKRPVYDKVMTHINDLFTFSYSFVCDHILLCKNSYSHIY